MPTLVLENFESRVLNQKYWLYGQGGRFLTSPQHDVLIGCWRNSQVLAYATNPSLFMTMWSIEYHKYFEILTMRFGNALLIRLHFCPYRWSFSSHPRNFIYLKYVVTCLKYQKAHLSCAKRVVINKKINGPTEKMATFMIMMDVGDTYINYIGDNFESFVTDYACLSPAYKNLIIKMTLAS